MTLVHLALTTHLVHAATFQNKNLIGYRPSTCVACVGGHFLFFILFGKTFDKIHCNIADTQKIS